MTATALSKSNDRETHATLDIVDAGGKVILQERSTHEAVRLIIETSFCFIVGAVFLGSFLLFILPEIALLQNYSGVSLSLVMMGFAVLLYAYATRGFVPQAGFDKARKQFWVCKLNSKGHARIVTYYDRTDVQGLFIRRPTAATKDAALCARIRGKLVPVVLIRGNLDDITKAHRELCQALHAANTILPAKPVRTAKSNTPRPFGGVGADAINKAVVV